MQRNSINDTARLSNNDSGLTSTLEAMEGIQRSIESIGNLYDFYRRNNSSNTLLDECLTQMAVLHQLSLSTAKEYFATNAVAHEAEKKFIFSNKVNMLEQYAAHLEEIDASVNEKVKCCDELIQLYISYMRENLGNLDFSADEKLKYLYKISMYTNSAIKLLKASIKELPILEMQDEEKEKEKEKEVTDKNTNANNSNELQMLLKLRFIQLNTLYEFIIHNDNYQDIQEDISTLTAYTEDPDLQKLIDVVCRDNAEKAKEAYDKLTFYKEFCHDYDVSSNHHKRKRVDELNDNEESSNTENQVRYVLAAQAIVDMNIMPTRQSIGYTHTQNRFNLFEQQRLDSTPCENADEQNANQGLTFNFSSSFNNI